MPPGGAEPRTDETGDSARAADARGVPFASSMEQLLAELARIDLLVRMHAIRARHVVGDDAFRDHEKDQGLVFEPSFDSATPSMATGCCCNNFAM